MASAPPSGEPCCGLGAGTHDAGEKGRRRDVVRVKIGRDGERQRKEKGLVWSHQGPRKEKGKTRVWCGHTRLWRKKTEQALAVSLWPLIIIIATQSKVIMIIHHPSQGCTYAHALDCVGKESRSQDERCRRTRRTRRTRRASRIKCSPLEAQTGRLLH